MKKIFAILTLMTLSVLTFAEENDKKIATKSISFTVVDEANETIAGAEISIEKLGIISYTDMEGNYTLEVPVNTKGELKVSFISFEDKTIDLNGIKDGKIVLIEE